MIDKRIVYTRFDGGVSVCCPFEEVFRYMCNGGGIWDGQPRGYLDDLVERMVGSGMDADASRRYVYAMQFGGCTTSEVWEIIRDRDCAYLGTQLELWDLEDIPTDRWFRNAWYRSPNGGPIGVSLKLAKPIQFKHI